MCLRLRTHHEHIRFSARAWSRGENVGSDGVSYDVVSVLPVYNRSAVVRP